VKKHAAGGLMLDFQQNSRVGFSHPSYYGRPFGICEKLIKNKGIDAAPISAPRIP
jgi:hypothetical protein